MQTDPKETERARHVGRKTVLRKGESARELPLLPPNLYTYRDEPAIRRFIAKYPFLLPLLEEIPHKVSQDIGDHLNWMRKERNHADYRSDMRDLEKIANECLSRANLVMQLLGKLKR